MRGDRGAGGVVEAYSTRIDKSGVQAVERAARLLEVLASADAPQTMQSLAAALGCSPSTAHRIVVTLTQYDLLQFNPATKRYGLGVGVTRLAQRRAAQFDLATIAQPVMDQLRTATGETVSLWVRSGEAKVCIAVSESIHEIRQYVGVGAQATFELSAGSRVLMADEDPAALRSWVRSALGMDDPEAEAVILRDVANVRSTGVVTLSGADADRHHPEVATVASPIFDESGKVIAALVVAGPAMRFADMRLAEAIPLVRGSAHDLTLAVGGTRAPR